MSSQHKLCHITAVTHGHVSQRSVATVVSGMSWVRTLPHACEAEGAAPAALAGAAVVKVARGHRSDVPGHRARRKPPSSCLSAVTRGCGLCTCSGGWAPTPSLL